MAFEKAKVLKAAEKFLSQGKIPAAIKEYRQIVDNDEDDLTALNMLGDLLARVGEKDEAVTCFSRIADHFREQGFATKAIAMFRKIEKLKPRDPAIANRLAGLYADQGLVVDARAQYLVVSDAYTKAGDTKGSLKVLHKIADLDAHNTEVRLKLAEGLSERAHAGGGGQSIYRGRRNACLKMVTLKKRSLLTRGPANFGPTIGASSRDWFLLTPRWVRPTMPRNFLRKPLRMAPMILKLRPMLAQAYIDAEDAAGAERIVERIVSEDSKEYRRYTEVARLYLKLGKENDAARVLGVITETMLAAREENDLLELVNEILERSPEQVASLRLLARIYWWQRDNEKLRSTLERLAESAETAGLDDDERYALTQLVRLAPDEPRFVERLTELGGFIDEPLRRTESRERSFGICTSPPSKALQSSATVRLNRRILPASQANVADEFEFNSVSDERVADPSASFADLNETDEIERGHAASKLVPDTSSPGPASSLFKLEDDARATAAADQRTASER